MPSPSSWTLDPRLANVPPSALIGRRDSPVSVTSPALEWTIIQLGAITAPAGRPLGRKELDTITDVYKTSVDAARVRIVETTVLAAPTTLGNQIRVPPGWTTDTDENKAVLVHEFGHIWQYQTQGTNYITCSIYHNSAGQIATGNRNVAYMNYQLTPGVRFSSFSAEEQATIIGDYWEMTVRYAGADPEPDWVAVRKKDLPIYEELMAQVRAARPRTDTQIYQESLMGLTPRERGQIDFGDLGGRDTQLAPTMPILQIRFGSTK